MTDEEKRAAGAKLRLYRDHPEVMVREQFGVEPDAWQLKALQLFPRSRRLAFKACKGPGKTAVLAWLILNFLLTRPDSKVGCTSITGDNLDTNLWPELAKWMGRSPLLSSLFVWSKTRVSHRQYPENWFAVARTWPRTADAEAQANALAGLHADYVMFVLDESGGIPQGVMASAEGVMASGVEMKIVQSGNPTHTSGPLYRACTIDKHLWDVIEITGDPERADRSPRISKEWAQEQIDSYGRDNPWVMVNVLGMFPPSSLNNLLSVEVVNEAMRRHYRLDQYMHIQKRLGVDVARFGDDRTVLFPRQGLASWKPKVLRNMRTTDIAARVIYHATRWAEKDGETPLVLVDDTGHWGHGVIDNLATQTTHALNVVPINYAGKALDNRYKNRRVEMWLKGAKAIENGAALPNLPDMVGELSEIQYTFVGGVFVLEEKDQLKARIGRSPDLADAYMQTYAIPDLPIGISAAMQQHAHATRDRDPYPM